MNTSSVVPFLFDSVEVRTIVEDVNNPLFVGADVASALGYKRPIEAVQRHCKGTLIQRTLSTKGGMQEFRVIQEPDLYRLVLGSKLPSAEKFEKWVFEEVLPSIRRTGGYSIPKNDKRVFVNHTHLRGTTAPGNLDIRYTMDLSKVVMRPTRTAIELLERLTGIHLADILPESEDAGDLAARFAESCLIVVPDATGRVQLGDIYQRFLSWHKESGGKMPPTRKWLASSLRNMGLNVMARGGLTWVFGVRLVEEVQQ